MFRAAILLSFVLISSAKILYVPDTVQLDYRGSFDAHEFSVTPGRIWVLKVQNDREMELKPATPEEVEGFEEENGPLIDEYEKTLQRKGESSRPRAQVDDSIIVEKEDIFRLLNKFALYTNVEPDIYLSESNEDDSFILIYFKSPYTSIVINVGNKQWNYFIRTHTPLPSWFYEKHALNSGETSMRVPEGVKQRFYVALLRMLLAILRFPLK